MIILIQIAKWFWALFPALIGIMSPTGAYNKQSNLDLQQSQLVENSDLTIAKPSPNENEPLGFNYANATDISLTNGIAKFTPTTQYASMQLSYEMYVQFNTTDKYYVFANVKADSPKVVLNASDYMDRGAHSGSGKFELLSVVSTFPNRAIIGNIFDYRASDWTPIEIDNIDAINLTAVFGDNIPDKQILDNFILSGKRILFTDDTTSDNWFNTGFTGESRDILDIIGYFFWLAIPVIAIYWVFRLLLQII